MNTESARASGEAPAVGTANRLHSAAIHLLRRLRRQDEATGLRGPELSALSVLVFGGPRTMGELAAAEQVRPPTISRLVKRLEREGLVARTVDRSDRRIVRLKATAKGTRMLHEGRRRRVEALAARLQALDPEELETLERAVAILERVVRED